MDPVYDAYQADNYDGRPFVLTGAMDGWTKWPASFPLPVLGLGHHRGSNPYKEVPPWLCFVAPHIHCDLNFLSIRDLL